MSVNLIACPHPFKTKKLCVNVEAGKNISDVLDELQPDRRLYRYAHVYLNDEYIESPEQYSKIILKDNDDLVIRIVAQGGGDGEKNPARMILTLVVLIVAAYAGPAAAGAAVNSGIVVEGGFGAAMIQGAVTAAVTYAGSLAINALIPPPSQNLPGSISDPRDAPTYSLEGSRNSPRFYQPVRVVYGTHRILPDYGALPFSEIRGNNQYYHMLFVWGYGPLTVEDIKIGETSIDAYDEVEYETIEGYIGQDQSLSLFPNVVFEENIQTTITKSAGYISRTTEPDTDEFSIDFFFPQLFELEERQETKTSKTLVKVAAQVQFDIQYALNGTSNWSNASNGTYPILGETFGDPGTFYGPSTKEYVQIDKISGRIFISKALLSTSWGIARINPRIEEVTNRGEVIRWSYKSFTLDDIRNTSVFGSSTSFIPTKVSQYVINVTAGILDIRYFTINRKSTSAVRKSFKFSLPSRDQYKVRVKRITNDSTSDNLFNTSVWSVLRSTTNISPVNMENVAMTAIRIKATEQLSGVIDQLNGVVTSILPTYDSVGDTWEDLAATRNPADQVLSVLQGPANKRPIPNERVDFDSLKLVFAYCSDQAFLCDLVIENRQSVWQILRDILSTCRAAPTLIDGKWGAVIDNEKTDIIQHFTPRNSWGFNASKIFSEIPNAWNVKFLNRDKEYQQDTVIVYNDGFDIDTATEFEDLDLRGVTDVNQAWIQGKYYITSGSLRPETYSFNADVEHIVCTRGDLIRVSSPVTLWGIKSARVKSITTSGSDVISVTLDDFFPMEPAKSYFIRFRLDDSSTLLEQVNTIVGENYDITFTTPVPIIDAPQPGDLAMCGEEDLESVELIVKSIEPSTDFSAKLICVDAATDLHSIDRDSDIPVFNSQITLPVIITPPIPLILQVQSDEVVMQQSTDGTYIPQILIDFSITTGYENIIAGFNVEIQRIDGEWIKLPNLPIDNRSISIVDSVEEGETYNIRVRSFFNDDSVSEWAIIENYVFIGRSTLPSDIEYLFLENNTLQWRYDNPPLDFAGFRVRYSSGNNRSWLKAIPIAPNFSAAPLDISSFSGGTKTFLVKAEDSAGNQSENPAILVRDLGDLLVSNVFNQRDYDLTTEGTITNGTIVGSTIEGINNSNFWDGVDSNPLWTGINSNLVWTTSYLSLIYEVSYIPTGGNMDLLIDINITADDGWYMQIKELLNDIGWEGVDTASAWSGIDTNTAWIATDGEFFEWPGVLNIKQQEYEVKIITIAGSNKPTISSLSLLLDVPDIDEILDDVDILVIGTKLPVTKEFTKIKYVTMTLQDDGGDAVALKRVNYDIDGPLVYAYDDTGVKTTATIDATVRGY